MPCQFGDSPMSLDKKNYITGNQKRQALFLNFLNFFIYIYKIPNSIICRKIEDGETSLVFESNDPQLIMSGPFSLPSAGSASVPAMNGCSLMFFDILLTVRNDRLVFHFLKEQSLCRRSCSGFCSVPAL